MDEWEIEKPLGQCWGSGRKIECGEEYFAALVETDEGLPFFERLAEETEQEKINFRFVLTLILMRKRRLKYDSSKLEDDKDIWRLKVVGSDKEFADVINPHLDEGQIEQLSSQLSQILQVELER
jgi:hypothetical protein